MGTFTVAYEQLKCQSFIVLGEKYFLKEYDTRTSLKCIKSVWKLSGRVFCNPSIKRSVASFSIIFE